MNSLAAWWTFFLYLAFASTRWRALWRRGFQRVRDFELGPTDQLRCYLSARGEPGDTLDRLASAALHQALSYALSGECWDTGATRWVHDAWVCQ